MPRSFKLLGAVIILAAVVLAVLSAWEDSFIVDEIPHVGAGYSYLTRQDMRINPEHPPLAKDLGALPLVFMNLKQSAFDLKYWTQDINGQWDFGKALIFQTGNNAEAITHAAKSIMLVFFVLTAILIFKWSYEKYGKNGALLSLILFSFSPLVIAHSRFVTTDIAASFGIILSSYFFIRYLQNPSRGLFILAAITFGIALLTKFSTFLLVPFLLIAAVIYCFANRQNIILGTLKSVSVFTVGFILIVWPVYYFHTYNYPPDRQRNDTADILGSYGNRFFADPVIWMSDKPVLRAAAEYGLGLLMVNQRSAGGNTTYYRGEVSAIGSRSYFPFVYFVKEPLAWWGLVLVALIAALSRISTLRLGIRNWLRDHYEEVAMLLWLLIYWGMSIKSNLNIGARHLLPVYPFTIILVAGQVAMVGRYLALKGKSLAKGFAFVVGLLVAWYISENISIFPYYLTYFNQTVGGSEGGYRYIVDSNLDWGQDLKRLTNWVNENDIEEVHLDYFGWSDPKYYLGEKMINLTAGQYLSLEDFLKKYPKGGYLAVSGTFYQNSRENPKTSYAWLDPVEPEIVIGNSIFIWHIEP